MKTSDTKIWHQKNQTATKTRLTNSGHCEKRLLGKKNLRFRNRQARTVCLKKVGE